MIYFNQIEGDFFFNSTNHRVTKSGSLHYHNRMEVYYLTEGNCNYFIDNQSYKLQVGDVVVIPKGVIHKTNYQPEPMSRLLINFDEQDIPEDLLARFSSTVHISHIPWIDDSLKMLFRRIRDEYEHPDAFSRTYIRCYVTEMLLLLAREQENRDRVSTGKKLVEKVIAYVKERYTEKLSLEELASVCYVSPSYLSRMFKKDVGVGISEYILLLRLKCAERMCLDDPKKSLDEIAALCGFQNRNYFSVVFKKKFGVTPSELRAQNRFIEPLKNFRI